MNSDNQQTVLYCNKCGKQLEVFECTCHVIYGFLCETCLNNAKKYDEILKKYLKYDK